ncbi:MAG TPA: Xaa-Pro peptidase family protein [Solirubrobacteraceae bacterium]|nr:Xaa-Pro peptidase family protein [Solirubrobacteraceae bacterium]
MSGERPERLRELIAEESLDALIVDGAANLRYLTGYTGSNALALLRADGSGQLFTDFRYAAQVAEEVGEAFECQVVAGDLLEALARSLTGGRVGFDDARTTVRRRATLGELASPTVELVAVAGLVERLRAVKDEHEIAAIAAAATLIDELFGWLFAQRLDGRSERELAITLEHEMRLRGASAPSFGSIVAGGAHAALPHAQPRDAPIKRGSLVTFDVGALLDGYCSDCTRTVAVGDPGEQAREIYAIVLAAQLAGLDAIAPGVRGREADARARAVIDEAGYGESFGHGLGHGVGLEIHEAPRLARTGGEEPLRAGNVVTVEPGIYLPGELGVRIEDLIVVRQEGAQILSSFTKELLVLD